MKDRFGRHHNSQLFRNKISTPEGIFLDSIEFIYSKPLKDSEKEKVTKFVRNFFTNKDIKWNTWPEDSRFSIGLEAGCVRIENLKKVLSSAEIEPEEINHFFSARLSP